MNLFTFVLLIFYIDSAFSTTISIFKFAVVNYECQIIAILLKVFPITDDEESHVILQSWSILFSFQY